MKSIPTTYNGYRFRSRLEARWAVFFDTLGVEYVYEPEGFEFEDGTKYLPDFYLPSYQAYVEIKAQYPTEEEQEKCRLLSWNSEGATVFLFFGEPGRNYGLGWCMDVCDSGGGYGLWDQVQWSRCAMCGHIWLYIDDRSDRLFLNNSWQRIAGLNPCDCCDEHLPKKLYRFNTEDPSIQRAVLAAKSAQFEFGRSGPVFPSRPSSRSPLEY